MFNKITVRTFKKKCFVQSFNQNFLNRCIPLNFLRVVARFIATLTLTLTRSSNGDYILLVVLHVGQRVG